MKICFPLVAELSGGAETETVRPQRNYFILSLSLMNDGIAMQSDALQASYCSWYRRTGVF